MADHQDDDVISITTLQGREFHQNNETEQEEEVPAVTTAAPAQTQTPTMANTPPWPHAQHDMTPQRQTFTQRGPQGPESYNGTMSVGNSIQIQRSAQQVRTTSQGPTLFQVYHNAQRHVHQNIYVQRSDDLGETQQALMQAHLERQRREYEFQLELQRRDRHEHNILQEARHHVQAQAREAEFTRQQDYWQYAGQAQMNQMAYQQQFEEHLRQRQEAMDREYQTKCQALEEAKQAWIRQMATQNTAAHSGNQRGEANIDVPSAPEGITPTAYQQSCQGTTTQEAVGARANVPPQGQQSPYQWRQHHQPAAATATPIQWGQQQAGGVILSGFSAPTAPKYSGHTLEARRAFGQEPIGTCMEAKAKLFAAKFHIQKPVDAIEDVEWLAYFQVGMDHQTDQYTDLAVKIKAKIIMGDKELDPDKRMDKWIHDYWTLLQRNHMMDYDAKHPKAAVKALLEGVRPMGLRESLRQELDHDMKYLRNSVVDFLNYVRKELRHTLKYLRAAASSDIPKESKEKAKVLKEIQKGAKETPKQAVKQAPAVGEKRTPKCWNCGGDHNLRSCTKASEAEKEAIAKKKMAEWKAEEAARGSKPKSKTLAMDGINGGSSVST
ncbi:unnamed protein product, partial [Aphanomyces euteiches]